MDMLFCKLPYTMHVIAIGYYGSVHWLYILFQHVFMIYQDGLSLLFRSSVRMKEQSVFTKNFKYYTRLLLFSCGGAQVFNLSCTLPEDVLDQENMDIFRFKTWSFVLFGYNFFPTSYNADICSNCWIIIVIRLVTPYNLHKT